MGGAGGQDEGGRGKPPEKENEEMHLQKLGKYKNAFAKCQNEDSTHYILVHLGDRRPSLEQPLVA